MALPFDLPNFNSVLPGFGQPPTIPRQRARDEEPVGPPVPTYADLDPTQKAWVDKQLELQARPRSALGEIGTGIARGAMVELPRMLGQALRASGTPDDARYAIGTKIADSARERAPAYAADENPEAHGGFVNTMAQGAEMVAPSLAALPAMAVAGMAGAPAAVAMGVGAAAGGALFGGATWQDSYEKGIKAGLSEEDAKAVAHKEAAIEFVGETAGGAALGKVLTRSGRLITAQKRDIPTALAGLRQPEFLKQLGKEVAENAVVQTTTEMGQAAGQAAVERNAGIDDTSPMDAATAAIGPSLALVALLGPLGAGGLRMQQQRNKRLIETVENPASSFSDVYKATRELMPQLEPVAGKLETAQWRLDTLAATVQGEADRKALAEKQAADAAAAQQAEETSKILTAGRDYLAERNEMAARGELQGKVITPETIEFTPAENEFALTPSERPLDVETIPYTQTAIPNPAQGVLDLRPSDPPIPQRKGAGEYSQVEEATARLRAAQAEEKPAQGTARSLGLLRDSPIVVADGSQYSITKQERQQWLKQRVPTLSPGMRNAMLSLSPTELADALREVWHSKGGEAGKQGYLPNIEAAYAELTKKDIRETRTVESGDRNRPVLDLTSPTRTDLERQADLVADAERTAGRGLTAQEKAKLTRTQGDLFAPAKPLTKQQMAAQSKVRMSSAATMAARISQELENGQAATVPTQGQGNAQAGQGQDAVPAQGQKAALLTTDVVANAVPPQPAVPATQPQGETGQGAQPAVSTRRGKGKQGSAAPAAQGQVTSNAAPPVGAVAPTPPPVSPASPAVAAPQEEVIVSPTGGEKVRSVGWGEFSTTPPTGDVSYEAPALKRTQRTVEEEARMRAGEERFTPVPYRAEIDPKERRQVEDAKLFGFEILNYDPDRARGINVNTHWANEYMRAAKLSLQKTADGQPTPAARNAKDALKWLDEYEGIDIIDRAVLRSVEGIMSINEDFRLLAKERADEIAEQIRYELEAIVEERRQRIAQGMGVKDADQLTYQELTRINNALAKEELKERKRNIYKTKNNQEKVKAKAGREELARTYLEYFQQLTDAVVNNDPRFQDMHAELPNYEVRQDLLRAVETGQLDRVLMALELNGPSDRIKEVAAMLRRVGLATTVRNIDRVARDADGGRVYARYDHSSNTVNVYLGGANAHTMVHEVTHAATVGRIRLAKAAAAKVDGALTADEKAAVASLNDLRSLMEAARKADTKNRYAFKSEEEFVAEVLSNEKFQDWLHTKTFDTRSMWRKFVDWVSEFLGGKPYEMNALKRAMSLSLSFVSDSRFASGEALSFNHSATGAMAQTDMTVSSAVRVWDGLMANSNVLGSTMPALRRAAWFSSSLFNISQFIDKIPALKPLVAGVTAFMEANGVKTKLRQTKQLEFSAVTSALRMALGKYTSAQARMWNEKLMGFAGDMTTLNIDLNKNFDENKRANPELDAANKDYINQRHAEYKQLPAVLKKPLEMSFRVFRKNYIQHTALMLRDTLRMYAGDSPQLQGLISMLDIRQAKLNEGTNPRPEYYHDAYSHNLDQTVRRVLAEAKKVPVGKDHLAASLRDIDKFYNLAVGNPYMHLGRSGDYYIEFNVAETDGAWGAVQALLSQKGKVIGPPTEKRHIFLRFENPAQQKEVEHQLAKLGAAISGNSLRKGSLFDADALNNMQGVPQFVHDLIRRVDEDFKGEEAAMLRQYLKRAYLDALPDSSAQKAFAQRKDGGVPGYDADFLRNFSKRAEGMASMVSNAYTMPFYDDAFKSMKEETKKLEGGTNTKAAVMANEVLTEMGRRFSNSIDAVESPIIDTVKAFGFNYFLAFSPAFWLTNLVQPYHLTLPVLGGRYGFTTTAREMARSTAKGFKLITAASQSGWTEGMDVGGFYGALMGVLDLTFPADLGGLTEGEREFLKRLIESGQLDTTQGHELQRIASGEASMRATVAKVLSVGSHYTEVLNRLTAGLTAYNLSMRKDTVDTDLKQEHATIRAIEAVRATQYDYSDNNTARALGRHGVLGKVTPLVASFQQYAFQTMELLIRLTMDSVKGTAEEKAEARKALAGVFGTSAMLAGTLGLPLTNAVAAVVDRVFGSDDDPLDVKSAYREWLADTVGKDMAEAIARGIPRAVLGFDTAGRMGMQDILPGTRFFADRRAIKDKIEAGAFNMLGPAVSAGTAVYVGMNKMLDGQIMDGLIEGLPLALKGPVKAVKMEDSGYTTATGNKLPLEVTTWDSLVQSAGFTPSKKAEQSEVNFAFRQRDMLLKQRKMRLSNEFYRAQEGGQDTTAVMQEILEFNNANPQYRIDPSAGLVARAKARATASMSETDIATLPRYLPLLERYQYANTR